MQLFGHKLRKYCVVAPEARNPPTSFRISHDSDLVCHRFALHLVGFHSTIALLGVVEPCLHVVVDGWK